MEENGEKSCWFLCFFKRALQASRELSYVFPSSSSTNLWPHIKKKKRDHPKSLKIATSRLRRTCVPEFHDQASETLATLALKPRWGKIWHVQHFFNRVTCISRMKRLYCGLPNCTKGIVIWCHIFRFWGHQTSEPKSKLAEQTRYATAGHAFWMLPF